MRGSLWPTQRGLKIEDLYARRVTVYRNTTSLKNRARQRDYIWAIDDTDTRQTIAIATEVPLLGEPLVWSTGLTPVVTGYIPPGQMIVHNADAVPRRDWGRAMSACILTSDGEVWATNRSTV